MMMTMMEEEAEERTVRTDRLESASHEVSCLRWNDGRSVWFEPLKRPAGVEEECGSEVVLRFAKQRHGRQTEKKN